MKTAHGFDQCYNGQIAVDETTQLIVATGLTNCAADNAELLPLIDAQAPLGGVPPEVLADAGYRGEATFQTLEARGITAYISLGMKCGPPSRRTRHTSPPSAWPTDSRAPWDARATVDAKRSSSP